MATSIVWRDIFGQQFPGIALIARPDLKRRSTTEPPADRQDAHVRPVSRRREPRNRGPRRQLLRNHDP